MGLGRLLVALGVTLIALGLGLVIRGRKAHRRYRQVASIATLPAARARGNELVSVLGRIVPSEHGLTPAPFSGKAAVWIRVVVEELRSPSGSAHWHTLFDEVESKGFFVDDGSGQPARILPRGAVPLLQARNVSSSGFYYDDPIHLEAFLQSRGAKSTTLLGFSRSMRYKEETLIAGETIQVIGFGRRENNQLVIFHGTEDELLFTNKTKTELSPGLRRQHLTGILVLVTGVLFAALGVLLGSTD